MKTAISQPDSANHSSRKETVNEGILQAKETVRTVDSPVTASANNRVGHTSFCENCLPHSKALEQRISDLQNYEAWFLRLREGYNEMAIKQNETEASLGELNKICVTRENETQVLKEAMAALQSQLHEDKSSLGKEEGRANLKELQKTIDVLRTEKEACEGKLKTVLFEMSSLKRQLESNEKTIKQYHNSQLAQFQKIANLESILEEKDKQLEQLLSAKMSSSETLERAELHIKYSDIALKSYGEAQAKSDRRNSFIIKTLGVAALGIAIGFQCHAQFAVSMPSVLVDLASAVNRFICNSVTPMLYGVLFSLLYWAMEFMVTEFRSSKNQPVKI